MRMFTGIIALGLVAGSTLAQVPVVGADKTVTLKDIVGTETIVTVVLKVRDAEDPNLLVVDATPDYFAVQDSAGARHAYRYQDVKEIRVQDGIIKARKPVQPQHQVLSFEDETIVRAAYERVEFYFKTATRNQNLRMWAAGLAIPNQEGNYREKQTYLQELAQSNDLPTAIEAAFHLYVAGHTDPDAPLGDIQSAPPMSTLLDNGLETGNRIAKGRAIWLCGLMGYEASIPTIDKLVRSRGADIAAPSARALGLLGYRKAIPTLMDMITRLSPEKAEAAAYALRQLGGQDVIDQLNGLVGTTGGETRFRIVRTLYELGAPGALDILKNEYMDIAAATIRPEAAIILAKNGEWEGMQFLRTRLVTPFDPNESTLIYRARATAALIEGGDWNAVTGLQKTLRLQDNDVLALNDRQRRERPIVVSKVKVKTCQLMTELGTPKLISLIQPAIGANDPGVSLSACETAIAIANPEYRERLLRARIEEPWSTAYMF